MDIVKGLKLEQVIPHIQNLEPKPQNQASEDDKMCFVIQ